MENVVAVSQYRKKSYVRLSHEKKNGRPEEPGSARDISEWLGKVIRPEKVAELLRINERVLK